MADAMYRPEVSVFDGREVQAFRARAFAAWQEQANASVLRDAPEGWSISPIDPAVVLAAFPTLRLRSGYVLRAHQYHAGRDSDGVVWALPASAAFPDPAKIRGARLAEDPPRPPEALDDMMEAIDGDGTPWSYLSASLFAREAQEIGASGHGARWSTYQIVSARPWEPSAEPPLVSRIEVARSQAQWRVLDDTPGNWRPAVAIDRQDHEVMVMLYAFSALGAQHIVRLVDVYPIGKYTAVREVQEVAIGPRGYVF